MQFYGVDAVKQVLAKQSFVHGLVYVRIGGTDEAHIDRSGFVGTKSCELALLDACEQFCLHLRLQISYLVKEKRAIVCRFQSASLLSGGTSKCSLLISEQLSFEESIGQGTKVDADKGVGVAVGMGIDVSCKDILACTVLAKNEYVGICMRHLPGKGKQLLHCHTFSYDVGGRVCFTLLGWQWLGLRPPDAHGRRNHCHELMTFPWFGQEVGCTGLDGTHHLGRVRIGGHHYNSKFVVNPK